MLQTYFLGDGHDIHPIYLPTHFRAGMDCLESDLSCWLLVLGGVEQCGENADVGLTRGCFAISGAPALHEAIDVATSAQKHDRMSGRVAAIPFQLVIRDFDLGAVVDMRAPQWLIRPIVGDGAEGAR